MVVDNTGPASFVLFDKEVIQFIRKTASELKEALIRVSIKFLFSYAVSLNDEKNWTIINLSFQDDDEFGFPAEFNIFKAKKLLFNVDISEYNIRNRHRSWEENAYKVLMISEDETKIKKWEKIHDTIEVYSMFL